MVRNQRLPVFPLLHFFQISAPPASQIHQFDALVRSITSGQSLGSHQVLQFDFTPVIGPHCTCRPQQSWFLLHRGGYNKIHLTCWTMLHFFLYFIQGYIRVSVKEQLSVILTILLVICHLLRDNTTHKRFNACTVWPMQTRKTSIMWAYAKLSCFCNCPLSLGRWCVALHSIIRAGSYLRQAVDWLSLRHSSVLCGLLSWLLKASKAHDAQSRERSP